MTAFSITGLVKEARRRHVFRVIALYIVGAWVALQIADLVFPGIDIQESAIRWVWIAALLGLPVAVVFGWRYDIVDGKISRTPAATGNEKLAIGRSDYVILAALSIVVVIIAFQTVAKISETRVSESPQITSATIIPNSIAVLPFTNLGGGPDNEYLSDGLTETLWHTISQVPGLRVTGRESSFRFKGQETSLRDIASQLGVAYVLVGSVQRAGNRLRVLPKLIDADTGFLEWSNTYDHDMGDIFAIQDDIASQVAREMQKTLSSRAGSGGSGISAVNTQNAAAYDFYLKGRHQQATGSYEQLALAEVSFKKALSLDPHFFEARVELAFTYVAQANTGAIDKAEGYEKLVPLVERLQDERPKNGLVVSLAARAAKLRSVDLGSGELDVDKHLDQLGAAVARTPNEPRLYDALVDMSFSSARSDTALGWAERGLVIDPLSWYLHFMRGYLLRNRGDLEEAAAAFARAMELNPENPNPPVNAATVALARKDFAGWFALMRRGMELDPLDAGIVGYLGSMLDYFGLTEEAAKYLQRANAIRGEPPSLASDLRQLLLDKDFAAASKRAETALRNHRDTRPDQFWWATITFMSAMAELNETEKALSFLEELLPGITSPDFRPQNSKQWMLHYAAVLGLADSQPRDETQRLLEAVLPRWTERDPRVMEHDARGVPIEWVRGNKTAAIEQALASLGNDPFLFRNVYFWKPVAEEPEVAARFAEIDAERKKAREEIWDYIVEHDLQL